MATVAIPASGEIIILSIEYATDGLSWARLYDNHALGWLVSEVNPELPPPVEDPLASGGQGPSVTGLHMPVPLILGSLALPAPDTTPVISPQWGKFADPVVFVPDLARMLLPDFLTWLATNNGAHRPLGSMLGLSRQLLDGYNRWAEAHPDLVYSGED